CEDEEDEIWRRVEAIAAHYRSDMKELADNGLRILCLLGEAATLCAPNPKTGRVEVTDLYRRLYRDCKELRPRNISIDTLSRAFARSEIDRHQVYQFASHMQALALASNGSTTVLSHPSLAGIASGSGISGSTAWHGAFRFRQYLKTPKPSGDDELDTDVRELACKKNQYGPSGASIILRWQNSMFLPEPGI